MQPLWGTKTTDNLRNMSEKLDSNSCTEFDKCMEILQLMLDDEASEKQEEYVNEHVHKGMVCFQHYEIETEIRELIKKKCSNLPVPDGLATQIRTQVQMIRNQ